MKSFSIILVALIMINSATAQWFSQNSGTTNNLQSVYFEDVNTGYAVGESGTIIKTKDGGATWTIQNSGVSGNLNSVFCIDSNTVYAVGDSGTIVKTTDGGIIWSTQSSGIVNHLNSVYFIGSDTGYAVSSGVLVDTVRTYYVLKTTNGGSLWTIIYSNGDPGGGTGGIIGNGLTSVYFTDKDNGYVVGYVQPWEGASNSIILKTINGGADWTSQSAQCGRLNSVYFLNTDTGYAVGKTQFLGNIAETSDGGTNWLVSTFGELWYFHCLLNAVYFTDAYNGYAVGLKTQGLTGLIIKTEDGGIDWVQQASGNTNNLTSVYFPKGDTGYCVGYDGAILKTTNGGGYPVGIDKITNDELRITNYPNPVSQSTTFSYTLNEPGHVTIQIFNSFGQLVAEPLKSCQTKGKQQVKWNAGNLPAGIYFYRIQVGNDVGSGKIIKW